MKFILAVLFAIPLGCLIGNYCWHQHPMHVDGEYSASQVKAMDKLIDRLETPHTLLQRQADAYSYLFGNDMKADAVPLRILQ